MREPNFKFLSGFSLFWAAFFTVFLVVYFCIPIPPKDTLLMVDGELESVEQLSTNKGFELKIKRDGNFENFVVNTNCKICSAKAAKVIGKSAQVYYLDQWYMFGSRRVWALVVDGEELFSYEKLTAEAKNTERIVVWIVSIAVPILLMFSWVLRKKSQTHI